jgi:hypothetical protein
MSVKHLPDEIDETANRFHFCENHWKRVTLELLLRHLKQPEGKTLLDYGCGLCETLALARAAGLELAEWHFDATLLPLVSNAVQQLFGNRAAIQLETGLFRQMFPLHGNSVLGLFHPKAIPPP